MNRFPTWIAAISLAVSKLAFGGVAVIGTDDAKTAGQAVVVVDSQAKVHQLSSALAVPEVMNLPHAKAFAILSSPIDGKAQFKVEVYDAETSKLRSSVVFDGGRLLPITPWPYAATAAVTLDESRIALLQIGETGIGVGVYQLGTGKFLKHIDLPANVVSISMPRLLWTADGAGLVVLDTTTGVGNIYALETGQSVAEFESYPKAGRQAVRFQIAGAFAGFLCQLTSRGELSVAEFPGVEFDPARIKRFSLWEGVREIGTATVSANGQYLSVPQLAVGQIGSDGTKNLLVIDLNSANKARYLVSRKPFSVSMLDESGDSAVTSNEKGDVLVMDAHNGATLASTTLPGPAFLLLNLLSGAEVRAAAPADSKGQESVRNHPWVFGSVIAFVLIIVAAVWFIRRRRQEGNS